MSGNMRHAIEPKSDQLNADDLIAGPITITITSVEVKPRGTEQPVSIFFDGDNGKPYKCCKSMAKVMVMCWGDDANQYVGRNLTLYRDPKVLWGGMAVGGIRISHMSHIEGPVTMALTETKKTRKPFTVSPMSKNPAADRIETGVQSLIERYKNVANLEELEDLTKLNAVMTQVSYLRKNRPDLLAKIDEAIQAKLASFDDDTFPGDKP